MIAKRFTAEVRAVDLFCFFKVFMLNLLQNQVGRGLHEETRSEKTK